MPRGRPPVPTARLKLRGGYRGDRHGDRVDTGDATPPTCPTWLDAEARAEWRRQIAGLAAMGLVAQVDRGLLSAWCRAWSVFVAASRDVQRRGYEDDGQERPAVARMFRAIDRLDRLAGRLGFSPVDRARLRVPAKAAAKDTRKERFFRSGG